MGRQTLLESLLQLLFPERCAGCRQLGSLFCQACQARLAPYIPDARARPASLAQVHIAYSFEPPLREAIHVLKYRKARRVARPLGELLARHIAAQPYAFDAVAAIPLHPSRQAARGFNQAEALAREVARALALPLIDGPLVRLRDTAQQATQAGTRARAAHMRGAFGWRGAPPPRRIVLVDDVYTTGATMNACAEALRAAGAESVQALALARSRLS